MVEESKIPRFYFDLKAAKKYLDQGQTPWTPAVNMFFALQQALIRIRAEGLENIWKRHELLASAVQAGIKALGLELFAKAPCHVVTSVKVPSGVDGKELVSFIQNEYGVRLAGGQADYKGKIFRFAHMGYMDKSDVVMGMGALEMALDRMGYKFTKGAGIGKVLEILK